MSRQLAKLRLPFIAVLVITTGCIRIQVLYGPQTLSAGETAIFELLIENGGDGAEEIGVIVDVPESWVLVSSQYEAMLGGLWAWGSGTVSSLPPGGGGALPPAGDGFQRVTIQEAVPGGTVSGDGGKLVLEFTTTSVPDGEFVVKFWFWSFAGDVALGPPTYFAINKEPHVFRFAESLWQATGALLENFAVAESDDGNTVVLGGSNDRGPIASVFDRDPLTGDLSHSHLLDDSTLANINELVFAPTSGHAYGVDDSRVAFFELDSITGHLSISQILENGAGGVNGIGGAKGIAVSPNGLSVYVAGRTEDAISHFDRNPITGELAFIEAVYGCADSPGELVVSPDGEFVYVANSIPPGIAIFDRNTISGTLTCSGHQPVLTETPFGLAIAPDGNHLYLTGLDMSFWGTGYTHTLEVFAHDPGNGGLTFVEFLEEGSNSIVGLIFTADVAVSPDGRHVFVSADGSLVVFSREIQTGRLQFLHSDFSSFRPLRGPATHYELTTSVDGSDVYYGNHQSMARFTSRSFADGFENGNTSAWSSTGP